MRPRRYRDLATGLPGIPSNVLAGRLKDLQVCGVIARRTLPAPTDVTVYELTDAGRALQPALNELLDWGLRFGPEPSKDDAIQPSWALLGGVGRPTALPDGQTCELRVGPEGFYLGSDAGKLTVRRGTTLACTRSTRRITGSYSPATLCASSTMARRCCCLPAMLWCRTELATVGAWLETCRPPWLCSSSEPTGRRLARDQIAVRPPSAAKTAPVM